MIEQRRLEDYMRIIFSQKKENGCVKSATISRILHVSRPTVSVALKKMAAEGYLIFDDDSFLHLTPKGEALAVQMTRYHDMIQDLLTSLGMTREEAEQEANQLEHALSPCSFRILEGLCQHLKEDPVLIPSSASEQISHSLHTEE